MNTIKTVQDRHDMKRQYQRWVPQSIHNENAIFSQAVPKQKVYIFSNLATEKEQSVHNSFNQYF